MTWRWGNWTNGKFASAKCKTLHQKNFRCWNCHQGICCWESISETIFVLYWTLNDLLEYNLQLEKYWLHLRLLPFMWFKLMAAIHESSHVVTWFNLMEVVISENLPKFITEMKYQADKKCVFFKWLTYFLNEINWNYSLIKDRQIRWIRWKNFSKKSTISHISKVKKVKNPLLLDCALWNCTGVRRVQIISQWWNQCMKGDDCTSLSIHRKVLVCWKSCFIFGNHWIDIYYYFL